MKLTTHHLRTGAALLLAGILLAGCDQSSSDAKHIKVGVINGAEQDVAEVAKKVAKEKYGLDVELVGFSGSLLPNDATNHGELDANVFQHRPFLEQDNQAGNDSNLLIVFYVQIMPDDFVMQLHR
ncbi:MetQ/NlpA family ABC transporter substrate-binding protein, partial [Escherichia coli]